MERGFLGHVLNALEQRLVTVPADLNATVEVGLRARHLEDTLGPEGGFLSEYLRVGLEAHTCAAPVGHAARFVQFPVRLSALERQPVELLFARHFAFHALGYSIGDRNGHAMQATRSFVNI